MMVAADARAKGPLLAPCDPAGEGSWTGSSLPSDHYWWSGVGMTEPHQRCVLLRHGETAWSRTRRHTGRTDVPLTDAGRRQALALVGRVELSSATTVLTSPLVRARATAELAGLGAAAVDPDLAEWDYGAYEGRTTEEIRVERPGWEIFVDGVPGGESLEQVAERADRVIARVRQSDGDVVCVGHAHLFRVLAARWVGLDPVWGKALTLEPASLSTLGWEREHPVVEVWNLT